MTDAIRIEQPEERRSVSIALPPSKSISARALIIQALSDKKITLSNLSDSVDTLELEAALNSANEEVFAGNGGTTYRFMLAYLSLKSTPHVLLAGDHFKNRPIGELVSSLNKLGAKIEYQEQHGFPPVRIGRSDLKGGKISVSGAVSSQYVSALLLIAPYLKGGLVIDLKEEHVSHSYIEMTCHLMRRFGIDISFSHSRIAVKPGAYEEGILKIEPDWSAGAFYYPLVIGNSSINEVFLEGLSLSSIQGDANMAAYGKLLGVETRQVRGGILLKSADQRDKQVFFDLTSTPDCFPALAVACAIRQVNATFVGVSHLQYKESDRVATMATELLKIGVRIENHGNKVTLSADDMFGLECPVFSSHNDHRLAMALSLVSSRSDAVIIRHADAVSKSYPDYWQQLKGIGYKITPV